MPAEWAPFAILVCHAIGDYYLQSDWMALNKGRSWAVAILHATVYTLPFLVLTRSPLALATILSTHAVEDHFSLGRYIVFASKHLAPRSQWPRWADTDWTGSTPGRPLAITFWLYVVADNTLHLVVDALAIYWL